MSPQVETKMFLNAWDLHDLYFVTRHTLLIFRDVAVRADNTNKLYYIHMGLWAWFIYSYNYLISTFVAPFSLMLWQNAYLTNTLFVIQEVTDTFGLILISLLFILNQLFSRNSMLYIFLWSDRSSSNRTEASLNQHKWNRNWQSLVGLSLSYDHVKFLSQTTLTKFVQLVKR